MVDFYPASYLFQSNVTSFTRWLLFYSCRTQPISFIISLQLSRHSDILLIMHLCYVYPAYPAGTNVLITIYYSKDSWNWCRNCQYISE